MFACSTEEQYKFNSKNCELLRQPPAAVMLTEFFRSDLLQVISSQPKVFLLTAIYRADNYGVFAQGIGSNLNSRETATFSLKTKRSKY